MKGKLTFLGSGGSLGVPILGCPCPVCNSPDPLNKRLRPSVLLHLGKKQFLIDAGPDFRQQALRHGITRLDGVIITHAHYDHTAGIDDLRPLYYWNKARLPFLLSSETAEDIRARFHYLFESMPGVAPIDNRFDLQILPGRAGEVFALEPDDAAEERSHHQPHGNDIDPEPAVEKGGEFAHPAMSPQRDRT